MSTERWVRLAEVAQIIKGSVDPQRHPDVCFAHYSIPAFDDGMQPMIERGGAIKSQKTLIPNGVVLVSKLNPRIPRVWQVDDAKEHKRICSTEFVPLAPDATKLDAAYLAYFLRHALTTGVITGATSAATKSRERAKPSDFSSLRIHLRPLAEQRRIVDILSRAEDILRLRREAERKAAELVPAIFLEMFGDPATNPKGLPTARLGQLAAVQGGLQVSRKRSTLPLERPYLRVANVYRARLDLNEIKTIRLTNAELERTRLERGDLLFVEGHGNPNEVGRVAVWDGSVEGCSHQNHLIRARPDRAVLLPEYASALMNSTGGRKALRRAAKTTSGLSTISTQNVQNVPVMLAPIDSQRTFLARIESAQSVVRLQADAMMTANANLEALLARYFPRVTP